MIWLAYALKTDVEHEFKGIEVMMSTEIHMQIGQMLKNLGTVIGMVSRGYGDDMREEHSATHAKLAHIQNYNPFGLSYLEIEIHGDRHGLNSSSRSAPLL